MQDRNWLCCAVTKAVRRAITPGVIEEYHNKGCVHVKTLLTPDQVSLLRAGIDKMIQSLDPHSKIFSSGLQHPNLFLDFRSFSRISEYQRFLFTAPLAAAAAKLLGSSEIRLYHDRLFSTGDGTHDSPHWHQDLPDYPIEHLKQTTAWMVVEPVPAHSRPKFVAGSHRWGWHIPRNLDPSERSRWLLQGELPDMPDIDSNPQLGILSFDPQPGDVIFFDMHSIHSSPCIQPGTGFYSISTRFIGDNSVSQTSQDLETTQLSHPSVSVPISHFPCLWSDVDEPCLWSNADRLSEAPFD